MNDFEQQLRETLTERSAIAPDAHGLADAARPPLAPSYDEVGGGGSVAAVLAIGVPVGLNTLGDAGTGGSGTARDPVAASAAPPKALAPDVRAESWHDVTFEVPKSWGHGGVSDWCASPPPSATR